jgi:hypothetical protein
VSRNERRIMLVGSLLMGLVGGLLTGSGNLPFPAIAQVTPSGQTDQSVITARALVLTDREGNPRARFDVPDNGEPQLVMLDRKGNILARLGTRSDGLPDLYLNGKEGKPRIRLAVDNAGESRLDFFRDDPEKSLASLSFTEDGNPFFQLNAKGGLPRVRLAVEEKGAPRLTLTADSGGRPAAVLGLTDKGIPELSFWDFEGKGTASLFFVDEDPRLFLGSRDEKVNLVMSATSDKQALSLYSEGKLRASLSPNTFQMSDQEGTQRMSLRLNDQGKPGFRMKDKDGHPLISLSIQDLPHEEEPLLALYDKKDILRVGLSLDGSGRPSFILRDKPLLSLVDKVGDQGIYLSLEGENDRPSVYLSTHKGLRGAFLGMREKGELALDLIGENDQRRAGFKMDTKGETTINIRNKEGKVIWSAPEPESAKPSN